MSDNNKQHKPETAGRLLTDKVPIVHMKGTVRDIEQLLIKETKNFETINYIYVTDSNKKLVGVVSIKEIFRSPKETPIKNLLQKEIISARTHTHQERIAFLALKNNIKSIPIIDKNGVFLGVVPPDTILKAIDKESVENLLRFGGIAGKGSFDDIFGISIFKSLKHRLPWLMLGMLGGILAAGIISSFDEVLSQHLILASFVPLVVYMAAAVGSQMGVFIIRDLAINPNIKFRKYFAKQFLIVSLIGIIVSSLVFIGGLIINLGTALSSTLAISLFVAIISSIFIGLVIPFLFEKLKFDPANASGPVATIIQDITSVLIYFTVASLFL